jgi:hypothetical protein
MASALDKLKLEKINYTLSEHSVSAVVIEHLKKEFKDYAMLRYHDSDQNPLNSLTNQLGGRHVKNVACRWDFVAQPGLFFDFGYIVTSHGTEKDYTHSASLIYSSLNTDSVVIGGIEEILKSQGFSRKD